MPGLLSRLVNLRTSAMAVAAGRSWRARSVPRARAAAAAAAACAAACVYTPAGRPHLSSPRRPAPSSRGSSSRAPLLPLSLLFSQAFASSTRGSLGPSRGPAGGATSLRRRVCLLEGEGVLEVGARVTREEGGSGKHPGSARS